MPDINGIPYVESTDLVSAYPAVSLALAQELDDQLASKLDLAGGKILQIVRATDTTERSTTSLSDVDASISVTITPQKADSAIILIWSFQARANRASDNLLAFFTLTDSSNNAISGAEGARFETINITGTSTRTLGVHFSVIGYATPATTSATTYKGRFRSGETSLTAIIRNDLLTGQLYAIEVSA